jgi:6-phosphogluconolactonase
MDVELQVADDAAAAAETLARILVEAVRADASIGLSGGSTPIPAYERAAALEGDWGGVTVWLVDERCVPPDDPRSNERLVREAVLERVLVPPSFHAASAPGLSPDEAAERYDASLRADGVPELVVLGVGGDGHTASLFPSLPALEATDRLAVASEAGMEPRVARVTMTLSAIAAADHVVFLVTGADKAETVRRAFAEPSSPAIPASLARSAAGTTTVILDRAAASGL